MRRCQSLVVTSFQCKGSNQHKEIPSQWLKNTPFVLIGWLKDARDMGSTPLHSWTTTSLPVRKTKCYRVKCRVIAYTSYNIENGCWGKVDKIIFSSEIALGKRGNQKDFKLQYNIFKTTIFLKQMPPPCILNRINFSDYFSRV